MKKFYLFLLVLVSQFVLAQQPFITTWQVQENNLSIAIPIIEDDEIPDNYTIDFGDGTILTNQSGTAMHTYENTGVYTVSISGEFTRIKLVDAPGYIQKILTIEQWGSITWTNMESAFAGCANLTIPATDSPNLSLVNNLNYMFGSCTSLNQSLNNWNVSTINSMKGVFTSCTSFNQSLDNWDVSNVTSMESMFYNADSFNQPLNDWDVSDVTSMKEMFHEADSFNQPLNDWNVSNVTDMSFMFHIAPSFNQPLNNWDVSNVISMFSMFSGAISFDQPLNSWDVSSVTTMRDMFRVATSFNQPINNWDVSNVNNMSRMFDAATTFNQPLSNWDVSNVTNMQGMFNDTYAFNQDISNWNFNPNVTLNDQFTGEMWPFIGDSGLDVFNYDTLLQRFLELELEDKYMFSNGLEYCNYEARNYLINEKGWYIGGDSLGENCGENNLSGLVTFDNDNNGCDENDNILSNALINITSTTDSYNYTVTTNDDGAYNFNLLSGIYNFTILGIPDYYTVSPNTAMVTFTESANEQELNFCITANQTIEDLNITILPINEARPGFNANYQLIVENMGTQTVANATVTLSFDEALQTFVSATPAATSATANQLTFAVDNILPFQSRAVAFKMQTFTPPTVNGGEIAEFTATVTPDANDNTPDDNTFTLEQEIVNSYDPNDKRVVQGETIFIEQADEYLDYIIRFQNTGTASAIFVRIEDELHPNLDWTTFRPISASHDYRVEITDGNLVEFIFDDINLPHEAADAPGSNGFIAYKIKPVANIQIGDIMIGDARIYFDYNLPIITNIASTEVVPPLGIDAVKGNSVVIYPNPVGDVLTIQPNGTEVTGAVIYNLQGGKVLQLDKIANSLDTSSLNSGVYILSLSTAKGTSQYRLIKK